MSVVLSRLAGLLIKKSAGIAWKAIRYNHDTGISTKRRTSVIVKPPRSHLLQRTSPDRVVATSERRLDQQESMYVYLYYVTIIHCYDHACTPHPPPHTLTHTRAHSRTRTHTHAHTHTHTNKHTHTHTHTHTTHCHTYKH